MVEKIVVGIVVSDSRVLMVLRSVIEDNLSWVFPGGKVLDSEGEEAAVLREISEETGLICKVVKRLGERVHPNSGKMIIYFACEYVSGELNDSSSEIERVEWVDIKQVKERITSDLFDKVEDFLDEI